MAAPNRYVPIIAGLLLASVAGFSGARTVVRHGQARAPNVDFALQGAPVGGAQAPAATVRPATLAGGPVAVVDGKVLVVDADSGLLIRTDNNGKKLDTLKIGAGAAQVVVDSKRKRAFVSDRSGDRVVVIDVADGLKQVDALITKAEPFGLALTPDGSTLLVTTVADHSLTAYSVATGDRRWDLELGPEPRGVAISPDGSEALVTFLSTGVVGRVKMGKKAAHPKISFVSIDPTPPSTHADQFGRAVPPTAARARDQGRKFSRNAFAAAYVGNGVAVIPHQVSTPHLNDEGFRNRVSSGYGGGSGFEPPVSHRLAFLSVPDAGQKTSLRTAFAGTNLHQPRAMAYDAQHDTLYVAGFGNDKVMALADVSQASVHAKWQTRVQAQGGCGPSGLAVDPSDNQVLVYCSLTRTVVRLGVDPTVAKAPTAVASSGELARSTLSAAAQRGRALFRLGESGQLSTGGAMSCSNCHAEARADSLSWFLAGNRLQTPLLTGRVMGSHPFKWDGKDADLTASVTNTVRRLGGTGINKSQAADLEAFLASLEPPRTPTPEDATAVARGKKLFESDSTACSKCHYGRLMTDQKTHTMSADLKEVDTPSLVGLAASAPYYHDGSAATLEALLKGNGNIHGMGRISRLTGTQIDDLVSYMKTL